MWEVLQQNMDKINNSKALETLNKLITHHSSLITPGKYFMVSVHREENVDNEENLKQILPVLNNLAEQYQVPVIVSTHPRTRKRIEMFKQSTSHQKPEISDQFIQFLKPFGFTDYINLQKNALCTISDSGTISEESAMLSFPAISLRQSMERPEAQDTGSIILTGFDAEVVLNSIKTVIEEHSSIQAFKHSSIPVEYQIENTSWRVVKLILGNTKLSNRWWGINK
jgi:UDP-N-acetylglucosamine 2-epimerase (non-hydrolysing)